MKGNAEFYTVKNAPGSHEIDGDGFPYISWRVIVFSFIAGWGPKITSQFETLTSSLIMSHIRANLHVNGLLIFVTEHLFLSDDVTFQDGNEMMVDWYGVPLPN